VYYKVNLLPPHLQREGLIDFRRLTIITGNTLLIAIVLGSYGAFLFNFYTMKNDLAASRQQLEALAPMVARVEGIKKERRDLEAKLGEYNYILKKHIAWSGLLYDLGDVTPIDLWLSDMDITNKSVEAKPQGGGAATPAKKEPAAKEPQYACAYPRPNVITFKGYSRTVPSIGVFVNNLYKLPYFKTINLKSISDEPDGFHFEITASVKDDL
jgi:type IV pilus assembly protein PilN